MRLVRKMQTVMVLVCGAAATSALAQDFSGDAKSDLVWRNYANGSNLLWRMDNATILGQTAMSAVTDTDWRCVAKGDFNNDGQADIVWRNTRTGSNTIWLMNGSTNVASRPLAARTDRDWRIVGTGDFSTPSDGLPDVLWHNARTGELQAELLNASSVATGTVNISTVSDISWLAVATGDFNGDGFADVLWRNYRTGALLIWNMNNAAVVGTTAITVDTQYANVAWLVSDVTDMNGDDTPDLIWRNALTGEVRVMTMDGAAVMGVQSVSTVSNTSWQICCEDNYAINVRDFDANGTEDIVWRDTVTGSTLVWATSPVIGQVNGAAAIENFGPPTEIQAVADFNRDNRTDIFWRNPSSGANRMFFMNGLAVTGDSVLPGVTDPAWNVVGAGDFDNNGVNDLVWRNSNTGAMLVWRVNVAPAGEFTIAGTTALPTVSDLNWKVQGVADFNRDGKPDLIWRNTSTGSNSVWIMNGFVNTSAVSLPAVTDQNWQMAKVADFDRDGDLDILWRNSASGSNSLWIMDGATYVSFVNFPAVATNWVVQD